MKTHRPIVIGNWKMNPGAVNVARRLTSEVKKGTAKLDDTDVVIAPPFVFLSQVRAVQNGSKKIALGAQDVFFEKAGASTGSVSLPMLESLGVSYDIIGHSERRAAGETDGDINKKVHVVVKAGVTAVLCVGERERDLHGDYFGIVERELRVGLQGLPRTKLGNVIIAYEPIWAIGTGNTASPEDAHEMRLYIEKVLSNLYDRNFAQKVRIIYGGSVHGKNADELMKVGTVDGFLVGGASLRSDEFIAIARTTNTYGG